MLTKKGSSPTLNLPHRSTIAPGTPLSSKESYSPCEQGPKILSRPDWQLLILLLLLAGTLRLVFLNITPVPARDSLTFAGYAISIERDGWKSALLQQHQHPGFPLSIMLTAWTGKLFGFSPNDPEMLFKAQIASSLAGLLLIFPLYYLGKLLHHRTVGFWAALGFQCLPLSCQVMADGLSDPLYLLLVTSGWLFGLLGLRHCQAKYFILAGFCAGLAYLVRPEGLIVCLVIGLVLVVRQLKASWRRPWSETTVNAGILVVATLLAGSPYYLTTGNISNKPSVSRLTETTSLLTPSSGKEVEPAGSLIMASCFAGTIPADGTRYQKLIRSTLVVANELLHAYLFVGILPVILGAWWFRQEIKKDRGALLGLALFVGQAAILVLLGLTAGYVSGRHVLLLVACSIFTGVAFVLALPGSRLWKSISTVMEKSVPTRLYWLFARMPISRLVLILFLFSCLAKGLFSNSENRIGHQAAGRWLSAHAQANVIIEDDHGWARYYGGGGWVSVTKSGEELAERPSFVVIQRESSRKRISSRPISPKEQEMVKCGAKMVFHWPEDFEENNAEVVVYLKPASTPIQVSSAK